MTAGARQPLLRAIPVLLALVLAAAGASCATGAQRATGGPQPVSAYPPRDLARVTPKTRAERTNFAETSTLADVAAFLDSLQAASADVALGSLGKSASGRDIPLVILSRPLVRTAAEAKRLHRPIVYLQGTIHGGEVEGKEATLALLRDLARDKYRNVVDSLVIVAVPVYNADGNDSLGPQEITRPAQNGPALAGRRPNAQGLDLNRDYVKAEAPETRAALAFLREWEPDVFVDLHTTNGSFHGYPLTYAPPLNPAARFSGPYARDTVLPALRAALKTKLNMEVFPYGNFASQDSVEKGWFTFDHRPRFGTNYYGLRGRVAILSEAYSHDPFAKRVASTYSFVMELLSLVAANAEDFLEVGREADRRTTAFGTTPHSSPAIAIRSRLTTKPRAEPVLVEEVVRTGDSVRTEPGLRPGLRRTGRVRTVRVPVYDSFEATLQQTIPYAYAIPEPQADVVEQLRRHGVFVERLADGVTLPVERFTIDSIRRSAQSFQGHFEVSLSGRWERDSTMLPAGTFIVRGGQPMGILALYLLEPESDDGLTTWNFMDRWLEAGRSYPVLRIPGRINAPLRSVR